MVTIFDVADKAGVSVVTVSRLLNNPKIVSPRTAAKIHKVIDQLNFQPSQVARSLVSRRTNTIGVIMPDIKNPFFNSWFRFVEVFANMHNLNVVLCNTEEDTDKELKYVKLLHSQRVDGVIIAPHSAESVRYLMTVNMQFIQFDRIFQDIESDIVKTDHYQGAFEAVEYLIRLGHKRIGLLRGPGILHADIQRSAAYVDALRKHHLRYDTSLVVNGEFNEDRGCTAARSLLTMKNPPTAIFSIGSLLTTGVIKAVQQLHLAIPKDISLIGFDEIPGQEIYQPEITHVEQPVEELARTVLQALIRRMDEPCVMTPTSVLLKPRLVVGESCRDLRREN
ncbi:MAG TPA: LacI family DNA-binding transcriptional regulator [Bacteroidota bacterium]|nr:LacI family DNA-binding transcriptional regulator [Bacteroidota bacterium]